MKTQLNICFKISIFFLIVFINSILFSKIKSDDFSDDINFSAINNKVNIENRTKDLKIEKNSIYYKIPKIISNKPIKYNMVYSVNWFKLDTKDSESFLIYPNPAQGFIQVDISEIKNNPVKIEVFNIFGKLLLIFDDTNFDFYQNPITINVSTLINGNYLLRITCSETTKSYNFEIIR